MTIAACAVPDTTPPDANVTPVPWRACSPRPETPACVVVGIDPGPEVSSAVVASVSGASVRPLRVVHDAPVATFESLLAELRATGAPVVVAIEMVESFGLAVGREVFETCVTIGRLLDMAARLGCDVRRIGRPEVKLAVCDSRRATDAQVREACLVAFGGTKDVAVGTKKVPGPLYGVSGHAWAALAVVLAHQAGAKAFVYRRAQ